MYFARRWNQIKIRINVTGLYDRLIITIFIFRN